MNDGTLHRCPKCLNPMSEVICKPFLESEYTLICYCTSEHCPLHRLGVDVRELKNVRERIMTTAWREKATVAELPWNPVPDSRTDDHVDAVARFKGRGYKVNMPISYSGLTFVGHMATMGLSVKEIERVVNLIQVATGQAINLTLEFSLSTIILRDRMAHGDNGAEQFAAWLCGVVTHRREISIAFPMTRLLNPLPDLLTDTQGNYATLLPHDIQRLIIALGKAVDDNRDLSAAAYAERFIKEWDDYHGTK